MHDRTATECSSIPQVARNLIGLALSLALISCDRGPVEPPDPPSGGRTFVLDFASFAATVEPILQAQGCDATGDCHGGGIRGTFELSPPGDKDVAFDFDQVIHQVSPDLPDESPILCEPLAESAGDCPHPVEPFTTAEHPDYQSILTWIESGEYR